MIIRSAQPGDVAQLTQLWQEAFGDPPESIEKFFCTAFAPDRSAVAVQDGQLLGGLYWFDCLWQGKKVAYIYAVATFVQHRGKGVCAGLMRWTHAQLRERGYAGAILVPAEEALFSMYGAMGYRVCPRQPKTRWPEQTQQISMEQYMTLRQQLLPENAVAHTAAAFRYLACFAKFYRFDGGICCDDEVLPGGGQQAMYLPLDADTALPEYFGLAMG